MFKKVLLSALTAISVSLTHANEIKLVIPTPPGGSFYLYSQQLQPHLQQWIGKPIVIESKPGGNGIVAANYVFANQSENYMFYLSAVMQDFPLSQLTDLIPVVDLGAQSKIVFANASVGAVNLKNILDNPKKETYTYGILNADAIAPMMEAVQSTVKGKVNLLEVRHKSAPEVQHNTLGKHIDFGVLGSKVIQPLVTSGQAVALAVASPYRSRIFTDVPTLQELGYRGNRDHLHSRFILWASPGIPPATVDFVRRQWTAFIQTTEGREFLKNLDHSVSVQEAGNPALTIKRLQ
jgi:tripartite-type tricarboxylate transporter receptor subunit TctC